MAYKIISPENIDITEEVKPTAIKRKFSFENINLTTDEMIYYGIRLGIGIFLLWFGITNAGSYYLPGTRLAGAPATFFYVWQVADLSIVSGALIIYHYLFGSGRK